MTDLINKEHLRNLRIFKRAAKRLVKNSKFSSIAQAQEFLAKMIGYRDFHHAQKDIIDNGGPVGLTEQLTGISKGTTELTTTEKYDYSEILYAGDAINGEGHHIVELKLCNTNNINVLGQTRSGKTYSTLSLVHSFAKAYPDTTWFFADGKGSQDYDTLAEHLSVYPVAKLDFNADNKLIQFANIIENLWAEFLRRRNLFEKSAKKGDGFCSTIYRYRELVGHMPQIFFVCDEFSSFVLEMNYANSWSEEDTIAYKLKTLVNQGTSLGIRFIFATQRYTENDIPSSIRSSIDVKLVHRLMSKDADHVKIPGAVDLEHGLYYVTAPDLQFPFTGKLHVKAKMPYVGVNNGELFSKTLPKVEKAKKMQFDYDLIYKKFK